MSFKRRVNKEKKMASKLLEELFVKYLKFKDENFIEIQGTVCFADEVEIEFKSLNNKWRWYVNRINRNPKKAVELNIYELAEMVKKHVTDQRRRCWLAYLNLLLDDKYGMDLPRPANSDLYVPEMHPNDMAVHIVCSQEIEP